MIACSKTYQKPHNTYWYFFCFHFRSAKRKQIGVGRCNANVLLSLFNTNFDLVCNYFFFLSYIYKKTYHQQHKNNASILASHKKSRLMFNRIYILYWGKFQMIALSVILFNHFPLRFSQKKPLQSFLLIILCLHDDDAYTMQFQKSSVFFLYIYCLYKYSLEHSHTVTKT